ncbi:alanine racemase [Nonlabens tegetincola]|uniref:Alanine racemase n=1 Tax=Nonlabens tegetincola TaxID=323273 RepID=A0A090Q290_9FLAO|nr:alanine racemase [Nonlabens tegetincola]GAK95833.1 alanine racemase [Nonlabens tegetincola]
MIHRGTRLVVNLAALEHNYKFLRSKTSDSTLFMAVVKAQAYGHGLVPVAQKLQECGVDYFAVAYVDEAVELRNNGITTPILVLHAQQHNLPDCIERCIEPVIYSKEMLEDFYAFAKAKHQTNYPVHLEFNTGLNRIGIDGEELDAILEMLNKQDHLKVKGLMSHLAASEDLEEITFTQKQIDTFTELAKKAESVLGYDCIKHQCNTSGILNFPNAHFDMVRSGIGLYGYGNDKKYQDNFKPVGTLKSVVSQVRSIKKGESISYNRSHHASKDMTYAVIPLGHGDGMKRVYGYGGAFVYINGKPARTLGIICMDMFMVDVTDIPCKRGDEVVIYDNEHNAQEMAEEVGIISYELITGIQARVPRVYIEEGV